MEKEKAISFKIINAIMIVFSVVLLGFIITMLVLGDPTNRMLSCVLTFILYLLPVILQLVFKVKFPLALLIIYLAFITIGAFCGSCLNLTKTIHGFDKVQHFTWGYISCFIGVFYLCKTKEINVVKIATVVVIFLSVSLATAGLWEVMEFLGDKLFGQTAQGQPINGIVSVNDAMFDIICHSFGSVLFTVHFCLDRLLKKNLGITSIINNFSGE